MDIRRPFNKIKEGAKNMDSKEMGLVLGQKLFNVKDLHYGFWEEGTEVTVKNFFEAQKRYSEVLFSKIEELLSFNKDAKILDVGCGVGENVRKLCDKGYCVDGLVPSKWMSKICRTKTQTNIYECAFEEFDSIDVNNGYDLVFFSESFQYVNMEKSFEVLNKILKPSAKVLIFDFFKRDGVEGQSPLGGGHSIGQFYELCESHSYKTVCDIDYTKNLSPNLYLVNDIITKRIVPSAKVMDEFMLNRYNIIYRLLKFLFRKKLKKIEYKYSDKRNVENFEKYKIYKMIVLEK